MLTGSKEAVKRVAGQFGLVYWAEEDSLVHTSTTSVIDEQGRLAAREGEQLHGLHESDANRVEAGEYVEGSDH